MTKNKAEVSIDPPQRRKYQSLFFKLFVVLMGSVLLTYLAFGGFYRSSWNDNNKLESHPNQIHYWKLLVQEIGTPPDTNIADKLSRELGVAMAITGPNTRWDADDFSDAIWNYVDNHVYPDSTQLFLKKGRLWATLRKGDYTYIFGSRRKQTAEAISREWVFLFLFVFVFWVVAWFTLHRMLRPVSDLERGVKAVADGNLEVRLSEKGSDELASLARSFNSMTQSLKERMHARDQLLMDVSHELRSPLTRMRVALEMTTPGTATNNLREEVESLEKMVAELLETERLQSPAGGLALKPENLSQLINEKILRWEGHSPGIRWNGADLPPIPVDKDRIGLVLRNILDNAYKYGRTALRPIEVSLKKEGNFAVLEVQDFGSGIPEKDLRLVFEPFYRVDRSRSRSPGYGLGLSLCKRIVEMHGGTISLASNSGEGTKVTIKLPLSA